MSRQRLVKTDRLGGVFTPVPGKAQRPVYQLGPKDAKERQAMYQCPVSAIPDRVWQLFSLWNSCRLMRTLPVAGGFLDQPEIVQRVFPILDAQYQAAAGRGGETAERAAMLAVGTMMKALTAGR